jgi:electron transfer flavoprotein beta subunit
MPLRLGEAKKGVFAVALSKKAVNLRRIFSLNKIKSMGKKLKVVVLAKQVPDTRNVGKYAMKADGTVNRAALPAIFNPEDLNALEQALTIKDMTEGSEVYVLTMGPVRAADIIRDAIFRGADGGYLLTDRAFAGADTLATSYALSRALKEIKPDIIVAGRQAIDGDTAQVGPQVAEKLGLPQVTYAEQIISLDDKQIVIKRRLHNGVETVSSPFPMVMTVNESAPECRPQHAKRVMKYKHAKTRSELQDMGEDYFTQLLEAKSYLKITEWNVGDIDADANELGLLGSPTKVKQIESVVFQAKESRRMNGSDENINSLMAELIAAHTIG